MSITSGFEKKAFKTGEHGYIWKFLDVIELLEYARSLEAQNEELKAMLKKHEWDYHSDWSVWTCPECGGDKEDIGVLGQLVVHSPNCALAKLLEGTNQ